MDLSHEVTSFQWQKWLIPRNRDFVIDSILKFMIGIRQGGEGRQTSSTTTTEKHKCNFHPGLSIAPKNP